MNIIRPKKRNFAQSEDDALGRLLLGYYPTTVLTLVYFIFCAYMHC